MSVSALAAPSGEEAGDDSVISQTQLTTQGETQTKPGPEEPAEDPSQTDDTPGETGQTDRPESGVQGGNSTPLIPLETGETAVPNTIQTVPQEINVVEPVSGLRFDSAKQEYAEMSATVAIPQTAEIWVKLDPDENRRQIIFNNYFNGSEDSWGLEVQANNNLRY